MYWKRYTWAALFALLLSSVGSVSAKASNFWYFSSANDGIALSTRGASSSMLYTARISCAMVQNLLIAVNV